LNAFQINHKVSFGSTVKMDIIYRPLTLVSGGDTTGAWRKVYCSLEYLRLVFKLMPSTEDMSYTTEEIRAFRQLPDYTAQFVQEFHC
jgi:hypothetical protein